MSFNFFRKDKSGRKSLIFVSAPPEILLIAIGLVLALLTSIWFSF